MKEIFAGLASRKEGRKLFATLDHLEAYRIWSNAKVENDPQLAVGGMWDTIGLAQFNYLVAKGLKPHHAFLDVGCGTLRGGRHFISYLDQGAYVGFDLAERAIEYGRALVDDEGLTAKAPLLIHTSGELDFDFLQGRAFDFVLAQSVFTHLPLGRIEQCFQNIPKVLKIGGLFFFTLTRRDELRSNHSVNVYDYPFEQIKVAGMKYELDCIIQADYEHPRGQRMVVARVGRPGDDE